MIRVGTPAQVFAVFISTAGQETWVPVPEGCTPEDPSDCGTERGVYPFNGEPSTGFQVNAVSCDFSSEILEVGNLRKGGRLMGLVVEYLDGGWAVCVGVG